jgi:hypothetical protein
MIDSFTKLKGKASKVGLTINENKTKYLCCTRQASRNVPIFGETKIEQVNHFKYLGFLVNNSNSIEDEIKERRAAGNKTYYVNKTFFQSKLISKAAKLKSYKAVIRPVVIYASETWVLKENITQKLLIFERKILRKSYGPVESPDA